MGLVVNVECDLQDCMCLPVYSCIFITPTTAYLEINVLPSGSDDTCIGLCFICYVKRTTFEMDSMVATLVFM